MYIYRLNEEIRADVLNYLYLLRLLLTSNDESRTLIYTIFAFAANVILGSGAPLLK
jgi:hypothetical protein